MKKIAIVFIFLIIIAFGFIFAIPIIVLSENLSTYAINNERFSFEYLPDTPSTVESLNLNVELGNIEIKYIDPPMNYFVKIDVNVEMGGVGLAGKDCLDYFAINSGNTTGTPINFSLEILPGITEFEINSLVKNVSVTITLRKDIIFSISTTVYNGNIELCVPFGVKVNNLSANITYGNILFDLTHCILEGNITGLGYQSDIQINTYNIRCTMNNLWYLSNEKGELIFNISQSNEMGANVTAIGELITGEALARVFYKDFTSNIGSTVTLNHWNGYFPSQCSWEGFDWEVLETTPQEGFIFTSFDFPTLETYNISLYRNTLDAWQPYFWNIYSDPI